MADERTHRWRNSPNPGGTFFVTASTLDRAHRFAEPRAKDVVTRSLLQTSLTLNVRLSGYVVLSNHFHLLAFLPDDLTVARYVQRLKVRAHERRGEPGTLWDEGYRGLRVSGERFRLGKIDYIHGNPLKYGLAERAEDYRWSSAHALAQGCLDEGLGLDLRKAMNLYAE